MTTLAQARRAAMASPLGLVYDIADRLFRLAGDREDAATEEIRSPVVDGWSNEETGLAAIRWGAWAIIGHYAWLLADRIEQWSLPEGHEDKYGGRP